MAKWRSVTNGRDALRAAIERPPDLVITDVMMPEIDGVELLRQLRERTATSEVPVMLLSARAGEESRVEGLQAGADDYVIKPFSARELVARVETQLLRGRVRGIEQAQKRRLLDIFAQAPAAIAILRGPEHVFEMANPWYLDLVDRRDVVGKPMREALPEADLSGDREPARHRLPDRRAACRPVDAAGRQPADATPEQRFFDFVYQPLFNGAGAVEGIAAVLYDVTDLAIAREDAEVANRAKDEFLAMLGHELRNPLAPILTALQLLRLRGIDAGERERKRHRAAGQAPRQPRRRSAGRLAHHARQDSAAARAGRNRRRRSRRRSRPRARCSSSSGTRSSSTSRGAA